MVTSNKALSRMIIAVIAIIIIIVAAVAAFYFFYYQGTSPSQAPSLSVSLNSPIDGATQNTNLTTFTYTPVCINGTIMGANLWVNATGWIRSAYTTSVNNSAINSFSYTFAKNGTYIWNVEVVYTSVISFSQAVFASSNNTLIVSFTS